MDSMAVNIFLFALIALLGLYFLSKQVPKKEGYSRDYVFGLNNYICDAGCGRMGEDLLSGFPIYRPAY